MQTPILSHAIGNSGISNSAARFLSFAGGINGGITASSNTTIRHPCAIAGTVSNMEVFFPTAIAAGQYTVTLQVNGTDTSLTGVITSGNFLSDATHSITVAAGDDLCWHFTPSGTPTAQVVGMAISCIFTATTTGESVIFGCAGSTTTTSIYMQPGASTNAANDATASGIIAAPGVIDHLYARSSAVPGGVAAWTFTAQQNEGASSIVAIITSAISTNSDLIDSITVAAGDRLSMAAIATGTPTTATLLWSMRWKPTTNGQALLFMTANGTMPANSADRFLPLASQGTNLSTETSFTVAPLACTIKNMYVRQLPQITSGTSRAITLRAGTGSGQSSQTLSVVFTNGGVTDDHDTTNSYSASLGDLLSLLIHPVGTPTALTTLKVGAVAYIVPLAAGTGSSLSFAMMGVG